MRQTAKEKKNGHKKRIVTAWIIGSDTGCQPTVLGSNPASLVSFQIDVTVGSYGTVISMKET